MGDALGDRAVRVAGEDAVHVLAVLRRLPLRRLEGGHIEDGNDDQPPLDDIGGIERADQVFQAHRPLVLVAVRAADGDDRLARSRPADDAERHAHPPPRAVHRERHMVEPPAGAIPIEIGNGCRVEQHRSPRSSLRGCATRVNSTPAGNEPSRRQERQAGRKNTVQFRLSISWRLGGYETVSQSASTAAMPRVAASIVASRQPG